MEDLRQAFEELPFAFEADVMDDSVMDGQVVSKPSTAKPAPLTIPTDAGKGACTQLQYKGLGIKGALFRFAEINVSWFKLA